MMFNMEFGSFCSVMHSVMMMSMRQMGMVGCLLVVPGFVMRCRLFVMSSRMLVMFCRFTVVFCCLF